MFHLGGKDFPGSRDQLRDALRGSLGTLFTLPQGARAVGLEGDGYPDLERIRVDLSGASITTGKRPPKPVGVGDRKPGISVRELSIVAHPLRYQDAGLQLDLTATQTRFDFDRDREHRPLLVLAQARDGRVNARISRRDMEALLLSGARVAAARQGVAIEDTDLVLSTLGPRAVGVELRVKAKKGFFGATIRIRGRLDIDDELNAKASGLSCTGDGIVGSVVCGFVAPHLQRFDGKQMPLMAFSLGEVRLRDVKIQAGDSLQVNAVFGS